MNQKNHALTYGLIGGLLSVAASLILDLTGLVDAASGKGTWLSTIISIGIFAWALMMAIRKQREDLGGFISFGQAYSCYDEPLEFHRQCYYGRCNISCRRRNFEKRTRGNTGCM